MQLAPFFPLIAALLLWPCVAKAQLTAADVQTVINQAVTRAFRFRRTASSR